MQPSARFSGLAAAVALVALAACGGDDARSEDDIRADIADQLEQGGLDEDASACVAEVIVDEIGVDALQDVDFSADAPPAELEDDISAATLTAIDECELGADGEQ